MSVSLLLFFFSIGILAASYLPDLPPLDSLFFLLPGLLLIVIDRRFFYLWVLMLGFTWGIYSGHQIVSDQLDATLEGQTLQVEGWIVGIPEHDSNKTRFLLQVNKPDSLSGTTFEQFPHRIQLSWYSRDESVLANTNIVPGEYWQLTLRLKRPRGFVNPGGFDYQAWLLRRGIGATGYVLSGSLAKEEIPKPGLLMHIDKLRWHLQQWVLNQCRGSECGILVALLIGDTSHVDKDQWLRMQQTGTSHLIAISGLHVGFLAIVGYWCGLFGGRLAQLLGVSFPAQRWAYATAVIFACFYSALAGFNIPTLRTMIMLSVFYLASFCYRSINLAHLYFLALALVLIVDPLAGFDMGFWLSFGAVAVLLMCFSGRFTQNAVKHNAREKMQKWMANYTRSQWILFIGLLIPLGLLTNTSPVLAPIANFFAIPLVTFFVVPCLLLGAAFALVEKGQWLLYVAEWGLELLKAWLDPLCAIARGEQSFWLLPNLAFSAPATSLLVVATLMLLLPRGLFSRYLGYAGLCTGLGIGFLPSANSPPLAVAVMDVGQGTAVVVSTPHHHLVYDTGPRYSDNFNAGSGILLPYLHRQGITQLDAIVVSHSDMDHAGGLDALSQHMRFSTLFQGEPLSPSALNCHEQKPWQWDDVKFRFLRWSMNPTASANNRSCVLLIEYEDQHILLPGDIESETEWALLRGDELPRNISLLLAAHHGSRTSSNRGFVNYTQPVSVIYSAGYNNQHGHPHPHVQARFKEQGAQAFNTAIQGAVQFQWWPGQNAKVLTARQQQRRYWYEPIPREYVLR